MRAQRLRFERTCLRGLEHRRHRREPLAQRRRFVALGGERFGSAVALLDQRRFARVALGVRAARDVDLALERCEIRSRRVNLPLVPECRCARRVELRFERGDVRARRGDIGMQPVPHAVVAVGEPAQLLDARADLRLEVDEILACERERIDARAQRRGRVVRIGRRRHVRIDAPVKRALLDRRVARERARVRELVRKPLRHRARERRFAAHDQRGDRVAGIAAR